MNNKPKLVVLVEDLDPQVKPAKHPCQHLIF